MIEIDGAAIGDGQPIYIVFEIGPTHNGLESAKHLVTQAAKAGANAVKFQILDAARLVRDPKMMVEYGYLEDRKTNHVGRHSEPLRDVLERRSLSKKEWRQVKVHADSLGITFFATASDVETLDFIVELGCPSVKIASLDINHFPLLREAAKRKLCIQLDTGSATIGEIEHAVDLLLEEGAEDFIIHHCPSGYPARLTSINLRTITTLRQMFNMPIAFSDHTAGWDMDIAAATLGANLLEKTITEDRTRRSPEHVMSLEGADLERFVQAIRDLEVALGSKRRIMDAEERRRRTLRRRSAYLAADAKKGTRVGDLALDYGRPGNGLSPDKVEHLADAVLNSDVDEGSLLLPHHLSCVE